MSVSVEPTIKNVTAGKLYTVLPRDVRSKGEECTVWPLYWYNLSWRERCRTLKRRQDVVMYIRRPTTEELGKDVVRPEQYAVILYSNQLFIIEDFRLVEYATNKTTLDT